MAIIKPKRGTTAPSTGLTEHELAVDTTNKRVYIGNSGGGGDLIGSAPSGSNTQVQYNNSGNFGSSANFTFDGTNLQIGSQGDLRLADSDSSNYIAFQAPATVSNNNIYTLPSAVGSANQVLQIASVAGNDATLQWATVSGGGGTPGGSDTQVQFNDGGSFGGDSGLTYNKTTDTLTISGDLAVNGADITTTSTGTATVFNTTATTVNAFGAATLLAIGSTTTATQTINIGNGATVSGSSKTITIGGNGSVGSTTGVTIGSGQTLDTTTFNTPNIFFGNDSFIQFTNATMSAPSSLLIFAGGDIFNIGGDNPDLIITIGDYDGFNDGTYISVDETNNIVSVSAASGLAVSHDLAINGGDITTTVTGTASLFNTNATTLNLGGVSTSITMGATSGTTTTIRGGTLVGNTTTQNLFNTTATTVNAFGAATTVNIGGASTNTVFAGTVEIDGANALKFPDDTIQVTRTPDFLLFDMGII
jgi:hypothetical protein